LGSCIPTALFVLLMVPRTGTALQLGLSFEILATNDRLSMVLRLIHDSSRSRLEQCFRVRVGKSVPKIMRSSEVTRASAAKTDGPAESAGRLEIWS
jgi:hypothetical protein